MSMSCLLCDQIRPLRKRFFPFNGKICGLHASDAALVAGCIHRQTVTAHQENLFTGPDRLITPYSPAQAVSDLLNHDIEPVKIIFGCLLYGHCLANTDGLGKSFSGCPAGDFYKGVQDYKSLPLPDADVRFDPMANAAYSYDDKKKELFSYDI